MILLVTELGELKANPKRSASGTVLEAKLDKGRGPVATILVQDGTLRDRRHVHRRHHRRQGARAHRRPRPPAEDRRPGDAGRSARARRPAARRATRSRRSTDAVKARQIAHYRQTQAKEKALGGKGARLTLESLQQQIADGGIKELPIIIKADVQGSAEVLADTLTKLSDDKVKVRIIHSGVGAINESDVLLATASNAIVIGFNVRPDRNAADVAEREKVDIRLHSVIYNVTDEMKKAMTGLLDPTFKEVRIGAAEVREIFKTPKFGTIAGCMVTEGAITRSGDTQARLLRDGAVVYEGKIGSLRRFKDDVSEVKTGFECGIGFERYNDIKVGDIIEAVRRSSASPRRCDPASLSSDVFTPGAASAIRSASEITAMLAREVHDPGHRVPDRHAGQGHGRPAARAGLLHHARRREGAAANRRARSSAPRRSCAASSPGGVRLRRVPELQFFFDESVEQHDRIERILQELEQERASRPPDEPERGHAGAAAERPPPRPRQRTRMTPDRPTTRPRRRAEHRRRRSTGSATQSSAAQRSSDLARPARRRLDRVAAGDGLRARGARQGGAAGQRRRRARALLRVSRRRPHRDRARETTTDADAVIVMECSDLTRTGRRRARGALHHQHRSPCRQPDVRRGQLVRRVGGGLRRDGVRRDQGARRAAEPSEIATHIYLAILTDTGSFHHSHITPRTFEICRRTVEAGRQPGDHGAAGLRQQQLRQAEADRRAARRDGAASTAGGSRCCAWTTTVLDGVRAHQQRHRGAHQPAAHRARRSRRWCSSSVGGRRRPRQHALEVRRRRARWSPASSAAAATRTPPASRSPGPLGDVQAADRGPPGPRGRRGAEDASGRNERRPRRRQALGADLARRRRPGAARAADATRRPHRHARSARDRRPAPRPRAGATRLAQFLSSDDKEYLADVRFGLRDARPTTRRARDWPERGGRARGRPLGPGRTRLDEFRGTLPADAAGLLGQEGRRAAAPTSWRGQASAPELEAGAR